MSKYQWQGTPARVQFGYVHQEENTDKPLYWYNYECSLERIGAEFNKRFALIPAIKVTQGNQSFVISNYAGLGVHKLLNGGWPNYAHASLDGKFHESEERHWRILSFNEDEYAERESERNNWFAKEFPEEFKKLQALKQAGYKHLSKFR